MAYGTIKITIEGAAGLKKPTLASIIASHLAILGLRIRQHAVLDDNPIKLVINVDTSTDEVVNAVEMYNRWIDAKVYAAGRIDSTAQPTRVGSSPAVQLDPNVITIAAYGKPGVGKTVTLELIQRALADAGVSKVLTLPPPVDHMFTVASGDEQRTKMLAWARRPQTPTTAPLTRKLYAGGLNAQNSQRFHMLLSDQEHKLFSDFAAFTQRARNSDTANFTLSNKAIPYDSWPSGAALAFVPGGSITPSGTAVATEPVTATVERDVLLSALTSIYAIMHLNRHVWPHPYAGPEQVNLDALYANIAAIRNGK